MKSKRFILRKALLATLPVYFIGCPLVTQADELESSASTAVPSEAAKVAESTQTDAVNTNQTDSVASAPESATVTVEEADSTSVPAETEEAYKEESGAVQDNAQTVQTVPSSLASETETAEPTKLTSQSVIIPAYQRGDDFWTRIENVGGDQIPYVIVNPAGGPGPKIDEAYQKHIANNINRGIKNVAYVPTGFFNRPSTDVLNDVDRYAEFYGEDNLAGIFFDEASYGGNASDAPKMAEYYQYVKQNYPDMIVMANAGRSITDEIAPYADIWLTSEVSADTYINNFYQPISQFEADPANANRIYHVIYAVDPSQYDDIIALSRARNAGWVMITDDVKNNPYDRLPTDFENLVARINSENQTDNPVPSESDKPINEKSEMEDTTESLVNNLPAADLSDPSSRSAQNLNASENSQEETVKNGQMLPATGSRRTVAITVMGLGLLLAGFSLMSRRNKNR
ncbi:spherulation-specific family 4 protein [Streptococcus dentasini]